MVQQISNILLKKAKLSLELSTKKGCDGRYKQQVFTLKCYVQGNC